MFTDRDTKRQVETALGREVKGFKVDEIVDTARRAGYDNIDTMPSEDFWNLVAKKAK